MLQGCPLGLHGLCLALWDFLDELSEVINRNDASGVWIADDLTIVVTRDRAEHIVRTCQVEFPQYGMETSPGKLFAYMPGPPQSRISDMLRQNGFRVSDQGLQRLLGAPIGSHEFKIRSASDGGHLQLLTDDAISFVRAASQVRHVQARYHLLRWSAATLLLHLGRLIPPNVLLGYATQFQNALDLSVKALLASDSLTPLQLAITRLPTRHGGMGLGGPLGIMRQAYAASAGAVARFLTKVRGWGERLRLLARLRSSPHIISVSAGLNDDFRKTENGQKLLLNPAQHSAGSAHEERQEGRSEDRAENLGTSQEEALNKGDTTKPSTRALPKPIKRNNYRGKQESKPVCRPLGAPIKSPRVRDDKCFRNATDEFYQKGGMPRGEQSPTESEGHVHAAIIPGQNSMPRPSHQVKTK